MATIRSASSSTDPDDLKLPVINRAALEWPASPASIIPSAEVFFHHDRQFRNEYMRFVPGFISVGLAWVTEALSRLGHEFPDRPREAMKSMLRNLTAIAENTITEEAQQERIAEIEYTDLVITESVAAEIVRSGQQISAVCGAVFDLLRVRQFDRERVFARMSTIIAASRNVVPLGTLDAIVRDAFRNPYLPVAEFDPRWRSETAVALARGIVAECAFDRMPILADALEETGCDDPEILGCCRADGSQIRHSARSWILQVVLAQS